METLKCHNLVNYADERSDELIDSWPCWLRAGGLEGSDQDVEAISSYRESSAGAIVIVGKQEGLN
ncbi:hypothetical protein [Pedosphaera parvula]|nr:hypothetical protein [Pedosphaera parvula]